MGKSIDELWSELEQFKFDESNSLSAEFYLWPKGTYRYQILNWFELHAKGGVLGLQGKTHASLWDDFGNTPINNDDEIEEDFHLWAKGTDRFQIWHWFDSQVKGGVISLIEEGIKMGLFTCPNCGCDIDTNDKESGHQVNDVTGETYCSVDCSIEHIVRNSRTIALEHYGVLPLSESNLNELMESFSSEGVDDDVIQHIKTELS